MSFTQVNLVFGWRKLTFFAIAAFAFGVFILSTITPTLGVPEYAALAHAEGKLSWIERYKYGVHFGLVGVNKSFNYLSKAGELGMISNRLANAKMEPISLMYEVQLNSPILANQNYYNVWEITIAGYPIRTYAEVKAGWQNDNRVAPFVGGAMLLCGLGLGYVAWGARRTSVM
jgi:hypothetical protein